MINIKNKRIIIGVTGSIAAYKSADLARRLRESGAEVSVVMTRAACEFITPLTMQALSGKPVHTELLDASAEAAMGHIELARWADAILVAPASANFMARLAHGLADDLLTTLCLASSVPILVAPAMNRQMWLNAATRDNANLLKARGVTLLGPATGTQACGETGYGRMQEPAELVEQLYKHFQTDTLAAAKVVVTAGPTREDIDPVRFISNRSSGRMGYAVARAAAEAGAAVVLVSGPTALDAPDRVELRMVGTAQQMYAAVMDEVNDTDVLIATAAVADYRCRSISPGKIKKSAPDLTLSLEKTPDILAAVASLPRRPFTVGFAAETDNLVANARQKLVDKNLDMIAANAVGLGLGFETEQNQLEVLWQGGGTSLELASKDKLARQLIRIVADRLYEKNQAH